jgi:hypothetical protein
MSADEMAIPSSSSFHKGEYVTYLKQSAIRNLLMFSQSKKQARVGAYAE